MPAVQTFGRYLLHRQLETTGTNGDLWLAYDSSTQAALVLKLLHEEQRQNADAVARFEHEIELSLKLKHPHLVEAIDGGRIDGRPYVALEWIPGQSVESLVATAGKYAVNIPSSIAAAIVRQVLSGLAYAHAIPHLEFVHRDISPANVVISYNGQARLIDYGLAQSTEKEPQTQAGLVTGTIGYIAPEQWVDHVQASPRTDVYSMGAVLWYLLSYAVPPDPTKSTTLPEVKLRLQELSVPTDLITIVLRALDPDPRARFQSAAEMAGALEWTQPADPTEISKFIRSLFQGAVRQAEHELETMRQAYDAPLDGVKTQMVAATKSRSGNATPGRPNTRRLNSILFIAGISVFFVGAVFTILSRIIPALFQKAVPAPAIVLSVSHVDSGALSRDGAVAVQTRPAQQQQIPPAVIAPADSPDVQYERAERAYGEKKFRDAILITTELLSTAPAIKVQVLRGNAYIAVGERSRAIRDFQAVLRQEPRNRQAKSGLAAAKKLR